MWRSVLRLNAMTDRKSYGKGGVSPFIIVSRKFELSFTHPLSELPAEVSGSSATRLSPWRPEL